MALFKKLDNKNIKFDSVNDYKALLKTTRALLKTYEVSKHRRRTANKLLAVKLNEILSNIGTEEITDTTALETLKEIRDCFINHPVRSSGMLGASYLYQLSGAWQKSFNTLSDNERTRLVHDSAEKTEQLSINEQLYIEQLAAQKRQDSAEIEKLSEQVSSQTTRIYSDIKTIDEANSKIETLESEKSALTKLAHGSEAEKTKVYQDLTSKNNALKSTLDQKQAEIEKLIDDKCAIAKKSDKVNRKLLSERNKHTKTRDALELKLQQLQAELTKIQEDLATSNQKVEAHANSIETVTHQNTQLTEKNLELENQVNGLTKDLAEALEEKEKFSALIKTLRNFLEILITFISKEDAEQPAVKEVAEYLNSNQQLNPDSNAKKYQKTEASTPSSFFSSKSSGKKRLPNINGLIMDDIEETNKEEAVADKKTAPTHKQG